MEKVICITSYVSSPVIVGIDSGDTFWTTYSKEDLKNRVVRWISLYRADIWSIELCELGDWWESRMSQVLD
jgi:hypothetical protein